MASFSALFGSFLSAKPIVTKPPRDEDGFKHRSGTVPVSQDGNRVLLISSTRHPGKWILPAGTLEIGETPEIGAVRETEEEAGVSGSLLHNFGPINESKTKSRKKQITHFFVMEVEETLSTFVEQKFRDRAWFSVEDAKRELAWRPYAQELVATYGDMRPIIQKKKKQMQKNSKNTSKFDKKLQQATNKRLDERKKSFVLQAVPESDEFSSFTRYFGVAQTATWLARTDVDPRMVFDGFEAMKEHLINEDFPLKKQEYDDSRLEGWKNVVSRLRACKVNSRDLRKQNKCFRVFVNDAWNEKKNYREEERKETQRMATAGIEKMNQPRSVVPEE
eukprot:TRINITY_DN7003_c0_g1_i1.p1 TRINITY_DN7003_c0_g1~~TRINITY_DN7003_c0_g1_i1.p1  ORF type:complete len:359 (+),score=107.14 TRINITY_DN7003_c0_g1_i1:79-1077(+)